MFSWGGFHSLALVDQCFDSFLDRWEAPGQRGGGKSNLTFSKTLDDVFGFLWTFFGRFEVDLEAPWDRC